MATNSRLQKRKTHIAKSKQTIEPPQSQLKKIGKIVVYILGILVSLTVVVGFFFPDLFKTKSKPKIQATAFRVFFSPGDTLNRPNVRYILSNVGEAPVNVLTTINGLFWDTVVAENPFLLPTFKGDTNLVNLLLTKEKPVSDSFMFKANNGFNQASFNATQKGDIILYFAGEFNYESEGRKYVYKVKVRFSPPDMLGYTVLTNRNIEIK